MAIRTLSIGTHEDSVQYDDADGFAVALDNAANQEVLVADGSGQFTSSPISAGGAAPIGASFVVIALDGDLTSERRLQVTANEIALTDGGSGGDVTLGFPTSVVIDTLTVTNDFVVDTDTFFVDASLNRVGINELVPGATLHANAGTANIVAIFESTDAVADIRLTDVNGSVTIRSTASGEMALLTNGTATENMRLEPTGENGFGTVNPRGKIHADQSSLTGSIPVLILDQADLSEELIEFVAVIGVGNPIEAVGAKAFTLTHFVKCTLTGVGTKYLQLGDIA